MMSVATPSMMPRKENPALTEMNPSCRRARRYRSDSSHSKGAKGCVPLGSLIGSVPGLGQRELGGPSYGAILAVSRPHIDGYAGAIEGPRGVTGALPFANSAIQRRRCHVSPITLTPHVRCRLEPTSLNPV